MIFGGAHGRHRGNGIARKLSTNLNSISWRTLGASRKRRLPREMKGVHPEEESSETGSEAPCVRPRGVQQKRSRYTLGRKPRAANLRAVARSEPRRSLVMRIEEAEPLQVGRRQHTTGRYSTSAPSCSSGVAGTARRDRKALNARDLVRCGLQPQPTAQGCKPRRTGRRGVGETHSTDEGSESRWREGVSLGNATPAGKDGRLWRH